MLTKSFAPDCDATTARTAVGVRATQSFPPRSNNGEGSPTQQELTNYKHPDWYGNDYEPGRYLMGLIMKVDRARNEATVRFGNYTATVTAADMGWGHRQPKDEFKPGYLGGV